MKKKRRIPERSRTKSATKPRIQAAGHPVPHPFRSKIGSEKDGAPKPASEVVAEASTPERQQGPCVVVAVGASAGGLEALNELLKPLPKNPGMAFVVIPHLDPTHESAMTELLSRSTKMQVRQVHDGMKVKQDCVYVIPPNRVMTIQEGVLHLTERLSHDGPPMPIDAFFRSLAADSGKSAIGVILSGTASDGTLGVAAIKNEGGITFAQEPLSAKYNSMPNSAIASGHIDFILSPAEIAAELMRLRRHPYVAEPDAKDRQIAQLKQELGAAKEYLQSIIEALEASNEELQSANEEIQSGNEELQSTNEELQTSKEELESANEELNTVNEEMQHRNLESTQLNNALLNLLTSVNIPIVMLDADLNIRRITPQAEEALGIFPNDVGRPLRHVRLKVNAGDLERQILDVIDTLQPLELTIPDGQNQTCRLRITPYRTADKRIDGVVLACLDGGESAGSSRQKQRARAKG